MPRHEFIETVELVIGDACERACQPCLLPQEEQIGRILLCPQQGYRAATLA